MKCQVYNVSCPVHGFFHGAEAEELRHGVEKLIAEYGEFGNVGADQDDADALVSELQTLLEKIDARDSLAYREAQNAEDAAAEVLS